MEGVYLGLPHVELLLKCDTRASWWARWHGSHKCIFNATSQPFLNAMFTAFLRKIRLSGESLDLIKGLSPLVCLQLTIIFKNFQECVDQKMYHAETDELPSAFADGSKNGGERHGANALRVVEQVPGQHVVIQARYIGTTIVVRQVGRYLTFAVRMPEEVVNSVEEGDEQDLYLCLHGCPANQRIDFRNFRARAAEAQGSGRSRGGTPHGFTYQSARAKCKERLPVEDLYFQSCVFDLLSSGDINFTMAAYYAFEDVKMLHSNSKRYHIFEKDAFKSSAAQTDRGVVSLLSVLAVFLWTECCCVCL